MTSRANVRVRVLNHKGQFLKGATVLVSTSQTLEGADSVGYSPDLGIFVGALPPGKYFMSVAASDLETQIRSMDIGSEDVAVTFVLGVSGYRYYYRGTTKVPFERAGLCAVALRDGKPQSFIERAQENGVDLGNFALEEFPVADQIRRQGVQVFKLTRGQAADFEHIARAQTFVRAAGEVVRIGRRGVAFLTDEIIFELSPGASLPTAVQQQQASGLALRTLRDSKTRWVARINDARGSMDLLDFCNRMVGSEQNVLWAEPNLFSTVVFSSPPAFNIANSEDLNTHQPHHQLIKTVDAPGTPGAWQLATGDGTVIAIIDGGCDSGHPDFAGKIVQTVNFAADSDPLTVAPDLHGTQCAGIAAGAANTGLGYSGVAPDAKLVILQMSSDKDVHFVDVFRWCAGLSIDRADLPAKNPAATIDVISCSWDLSSLALSPEMIEAFDALAKANCVVLFSSGDIDKEFDIDGEFDKQDYGALAAYPKNIAVGSSTFAQPQNRAPDSSYGADLALVAPGGGALSGETKTTYPTTCGNHGTFCGTSCACPQVAGVVALIQSARRANGQAPLTPAAVREILTANAEKIPDAAAYNTAGFNIHCGFGQVDARQAVAGAVAAT
jgi:subtilisin family serine protease